MILYVRKEQPSRCSGIIKTYYDVCYYREKRSCGGKVQFSGQYNTDKVKEMYALRGAEVSFVSNPDDIATQEIFGMLHKYSRKIFDDTGLTFPCHEQLLLSFFKGAILHESNNIGWEDAARIAGEELGTSVY